MTHADSLRRIKVLHTILWTFFVACIVAIPVLAFMRRYVQAGALIGVVLMEVLVLVANHLRCPLTDLAEKHTDDRSDNFDIYLPVWVARHNKLLFGVLFLVGALYTLARWAGWLE